MDTFRGFYSVYHSLKDKNTEIVTFQPVPPAKVEFYLLPIPRAAWNHTT